MTKNLVIVESPAKSKTIQQFLGKDYKVTSSFGHIRDLPKNKMAVDIEHNFTPEYEISTGKKQVVKDLKKAIDKDTLVWLATDEDREGEAIAWHLSEALKINQSKIKRIVFHEITKNAILEAINNPRLLNIDLVDAQQARRVLDRLVGYELSPVLWRKVRAGLSAGRVQSVAVRLIVERERQILKFKPESSYKVYAQLKTEDNKELKAVYEGKIKDLTTAKSILSNIQANNFKVSSLSDSKGQRNPSPPFTTSTLQQEASQRLGYSVKQTMSIAQKLYEAGLITYMRTDSLNLSEQSLDAAAKYIKSTYGPKFLISRTFKTKAKGAQEAHEAIRPTNVSKETASTDEHGNRLYQMIRGRFLASQMAPAILNKTSIKIIGSKADLKAEGEIIEFEGWLKVYPQSSIKDKLLPKLKIGSRLDLIEATADEVLSRPPARFSEATLVKQLEEMGIGRPSTYAPTISTIQAREYILNSNAPQQTANLTVLKLLNGNIHQQSIEKIIGNEKKKLLPTDIAYVVTDFLVKNFSQIIDFDFTAQVEAKFDDIAMGKQQWTDMIKNFYTDFHKSLEQAKNVSREEAQQTRLIGQDPKTNKPIYSRFGRFGPMLQRGESLAKGEDGEKPDFAPMPPSSTMDNVTLDQALIMFSLPKNLGQYENQDITANIGRYGPYVKIGQNFTSVPKEEDIFSITLERAIELINQKALNNQKMIVKTLKDGVIVKNGRFGPYVTDGKLNAKIPKNIDPEKITLTDAKNLLNKKRKHK